jgi:site-specific recombinase XerD
MSGPLAPFAEAYRAELKARGYTVRSAVSEQRQVARFSRWLEETGHRIADLDAGCVEEFLGFQRREGRCRSQWSRPGLMSLLDVLGGLGVLAERRSRPASSPEDALLDSFGRYLLVERGLANGTVRGYVDRSRRFLSDVAGIGGLGAMTAADVTSAVLRESGAVSVSTTQNFVASVKSFLRFGFVEGLIEVDLSEAALAITGRRRSSLPRGITAADTKALLASCDRRSTLGRRDYALLVTLLRLGLRRSEVASLRLDDIDWRAGELLVRGKRSRLDRLPLPSDVGEAIAGYLQRRRPTTNHREVFLRARAPYEPMAAATVASTVRRACRRAGIAEVGSHRLRHTAACGMVAAGVPLVEIAQVLRHQSLQTTAVYARIDVERLRLLAAPWPRGARQ